MLKNPEAFIFDMDGTLLDSLSVWADSDCEFITSLGYEYDHKHSYAMKTMHFDSACDYLAEAFSLNLSSKEIGSRILQIVEEKHLHGIDLKDGALNFIRTAHEKGIKMCVATSNNKELARKSLEAHGIAEYMKFLITSDEVGCGKESPLIFERAAKMLGAVPSKAVVFEDSIHAVESAKKAGFYVVGVHDPLCEEEFAKIKKAADLTIHSYNEIPL